MSTETKARDWASIGVDWERITVSKDDTLIGHVWSPRAIGTAAGNDAMVAHFGPARVAAWLNGSGTFDVRARSWYKGRWTKSRDAVRMSDDAMKEAVAQSVLYATRGRTVTTIRVISIGVFSVTLQPGTAYEYAQLHNDALAANLEAMPDAPPAMIREMVTKSLANAGIVPDDDEDEDDDA